MWWWWVVPLVSGLMCFFSFGLGIESGKKTEKARKEEEEKKAAAATDWVYLGQTEYWWVKSGTKEKVDVQYVRFHGERGSLKSHRKIEHQFGYLAAGYGRDTLTHNHKYQTGAADWLQGGDFYKAIEQPSPPLQAAAAQDGLKWDEAQKKWAPLDGGVTSTELSKADTEDLVDLLSKVRDNESKESTT